jgi:hypothetical protein
MAEDNETKILGNKATIYTNKFGMWQFRLWLSNENKYVRKSLKTKEKTLAIERGEEQYIEARSKEVGSGNVGIVKGRLDTIKTHLKHFLEYVRKDEKVSNYKLAKAVGLKVGSRTTNEAYDKAYEHRKNQLLLHVRRRQQ